VTVQEEGNMIQVRRAGERHHDRRRRQELWRTFYRQDKAQSANDGFGNLEILNELRLPPGADVPRRARRDAEIITYVREGALTHEGAAGASEVIRAGEFRRMTEGQSMRHGEANASRTDWAHLFQIWLRPAEAGREPEHEQRRFSAAERRGGLCVVASPDARKGSLRIRQDVLMYSALLDAGQHIVHEVTADRRVWLHVVHGEIAVGDLELTTGDGAGFTGERAVSLTALQGAEILLLDLGEQPPWSQSSGGAS
jgi:quercetin 2,3-dioxygenase